MDAETQHKPHASFQGICIAVNMPNIYRYIRICPFAVYLTLITYYENLRILISMLLDVSVCRNSENAYGGMMSIRRTVALATFSYSKDFCQQSFRTDSIGLHRRYKNINHELPKPDWEEHMNN